MSVGVLNPLITHTNRRYVHNVKLTYTSSITKKLLTFKNIFQKHSITFFFIKTLGILQKPDALQGYTKK